jgi:hypothetical protein
MRPPIVPANNFNASQTALLSRTMICRSAGGGRVSAAPVGLIRVIGRWRLTALVVNGIIGEKIPAFRLFSDIEDDTKLPDELDQLKLL